MFKQAAAKAGIAAERVTGYAADSTQSAVQAGPSAITGAGPCTLLPVVYVLYLYPYEYVFVCYLCLMHAGIVSILAIPSNLRVVCCDYTA